MSPAGHAPDLPGRTDDTYEAPAVVRKLALVGHLLRQTGARSLEGLA